MRAYIKTQLTFAYIFIEHNKSNPTVNIDILDRVKHIKPLKFVELAVSAISIKRWLEWTSRFIEILI